ncbi:MAG: hypothetical protein ACM3RX_00275 [Methanococcaceae archaeon]
MFIAVIVLDLGGTKLAGAVFDNRGNIMRKEIVPLEKERENRSAH